MRHLTTKIRAAVGAAMIVAFASPAAAQRPQAPVQTARFEAQWLENRGPGRQMVRWRVARGRMAAVAWRRGYARGYMAGRFGYRAAFARRPYAGGWVMRGRGPYDRGAAWGLRMRWRRGI